MNAYSLYSVSAPAVSIESSKTIRWNNRELCGVLHWANGAILGKHTHGVPDGSKALTTKNHEKTHFSFSLSASSHLSRMKCRRWLCWKNNESKEWVFSEKAAELNNVFSIASRTSELRAASGEPRVKEWNEAETNDGTHTHKHWNELKTKRKKRTRHDFSFYLFGFAFVCWNSKIKNERKKTNEE